MQNLPVDFSGALKNDFFKNFSQKIKIRNMDNSKIKSIHTRRIQKNLYTPFHEYSINSISKKNFDSISNLFFYFELRKLLTFFFYG
jgi:hypothetical protein